MASKGPPDPIYILRGCNGPVTSLVFTSSVGEMVEDTRTSSTGTGTTAKLVSGTQDGQIDVWDLSVWRPIFTTNLHHGSSVLSLHERRDKDGVLVSQGRDGSLIEVDLNAQSCTTLENLRSPALGFCRVCWTELNRESVLIVPSDNKSQLDVISVTNCTKISSLVPSGGSTAYGMCMTIQPIQRPAQSYYILVGYEDGSASIWDLRTSKEIQHTQIHPESIMAMDYHSDLTRGVSGSADNNLKTWKITNSQNIECMRDIELTNPGVACVRFRGDGKFFVSGGWDGNIRAFGSKKGGALAVLGHHQETVQCCSFSPDGMLAAGGKDRHISFWNIYR